MSMRFKYRKIALGIQVYGTRSDGLLTSHLALKLFESDILEIEVRNIIFVRENGQN